MTRRSAGWLLHAVVLLLLPSAWTPVPALAQDRAVTVCAGGDMMLGSNLPQQGGAPPELPAPSWTELRQLITPLTPLMERADIVLLNIEGAIGSGPAPRKCRAQSTGCYAFRQPVEAARAYREIAPSAQVVGAIANNHAKDAGVEGFYRTAAFLREAGVHVVGADTMPTMIPVAGGDSIAMLAFSTFSAGPDARNLEAVRRHIVRAAARTRRIVVSVHHGAEGARAQRTADRVETFLGENRGNPVAFARTAVEAGASLVIGHGPHVLRAAEWRGESLVFYSLGNLLTNGRFNVAGPSGVGTVACAALSPAGEVTTAWIRPTRQPVAGRLVADVEGRAIRLIDSLSSLDFPSTGAAVASDGTLSRRLPRD